MPPRITLLPPGGSPLCLRPAPVSSTFSLSIPSAAHASTDAVRQQLLRRRQDQYAVEQAKARRESNLRRRDELIKERLVAMGDPVRGIETPFLKSFDIVGDTTADVYTTAPDGTVIKADPERHAPLNHFIKRAEVETAIEHSRRLAEPIDKSSGGTVTEDPNIKDQEFQRFQEGHERAAAAIARIVNMSNASQLDKTRANSQRCIETFGRHRTDGVLRPTPKTSAQLAMDPSKRPVKTPRAGPDTGSSEVQIAILTAKIRVLADQLAAHGGKKDKVNKRNLTVMVHKRQKLLQYMRRKERGGDRWQHLIETLGLTEGTWKGEISL